MTLDNEDEEGDLLNEDSGDVSGVDLDVPGAADDANEDIGESLGWMEKIKVKGLLLYFARGKKVSWIFCYFYTIAIWADSHSVVPHGVLVLRYPLDNPLLNTLIRL